MLSPNCSPLKSCSPQSALRSNSALLKVLFTKKVLFPKCSQSKKCSPKGHFRKFALSKCFLPEKTVYEQVCFENNNSKIFLGYSYFPSSKISFRVANFKIDCSNIHFLKSCVPKKMYKSILIVRFSEMLSKTKQQDELSTGRLLLLN